MYGMILVDHEFYLMIRTNRQAWPRTGAGAEDNGDVIYDRREILILGEALMAHGGLSPSDLGRAAAGHDKLFVRLRDGGSTPAYGWATGGHRR
jgi:hypothetical protein